jgi:hypothetical protein
LQEEDQVDHIITLCPHARTVWLGCLQTNQFEVDLPHLAYTLEEWWLRAGREVQKSDRRRFDSLVTLVAWTLWKQRNARVFGNVRLQLNTEQIIDSVREEFRLWEFVRVVGRQIVPRE